jgi:signal transduction histidine kinase
MRIEDLKLTHPWQVWTSLVSALLVVAAAVGWLSWRATESDREQAAARRQAVIEENVRLALWRMDSLMAAFVAQESARPVAAYEIPGTPGMHDNSRGSVPGAVFRAPSLLIEPPPQVLIYFQRDARRNITSPQVRRGDEADVDSSNANAEKVDLYGSRLARLKALVNFDEIDFVEIEERLTRMLQLHGDAGGLANSLLQPGQGDQNAYLDLPEEQSLRQQAQGVNEYRRRSNYVALNNSAIQSANPDASVIDNVGAPLVASTMIPLVVRDELLLVRSVSVGNERWLQGCWIDWERLRRDLLAEIGDLLPNADLALVARPLESEQTRMLAALPVRIDPGPVAAALTGISPVRLALVVAWAAMALAALAVAVLLRGVVALSERRADFVSAVTHELRTPLTTFRLYAEMLAAGMVPDEVAKARYLDTLSVEADRLTHLVENVLAYARLERGGLGNRIQPVRGDELLKLATERLADRAREAGMELAISTDEIAPNAIVLCDASAVEQILFNLVDNACKYAAAAEDKTITLDARIAAARLCLRVRDHGPGLPAEQRRRLFQPFRKSADEAARTAPGVGLGLSLSRRLARDMRGDLALDEATANGAAFILSLPLRA